MYWKTTTTAFLMMVFLSTAVAGTFSFSGYSWSTYLPNSGASFLLLEDHNVTPLNGLLGGSTWSSDADSMTYVTNPGTPNELLHLRFVRGPNQYYAFNLNTQAGRDLNLRYVYLDSDSIWYMQHRLLNLRLHYYGRDTITNGANHADSVQDTVNANWCKKIRHSMEDTLVWFSTDLNTVRTFKYGRFKWELASPIDTNLNDNIDPAFWIYDTSNRGPNQYQGNEIDFEFSRFTQQDPSRASNGKLFCEDGGAGIYKGAENFADEVSNKDNKICYL